MRHIKLSIIMAVYNEVNTILEVIRLVKNEEHRKEIIIVDDGSTDGTRELLQQVNDKNIKVLFNEVNRGKGYSIRRALEYVSGDIVIIQDADLEYYPDEYSVLIDKIIEGKADVVYGSRFLGAHRVFYFYHYLGNLILNLVANISLNTTLTDLMTCYKAFKSSAIKKLRLEADRFGIEVEITAEVFKRRYRVYEVPISYNGRSYEEGKKIRWMDFFSCLYWLAKSVRRGIDVVEDTLLKMQVMSNNNLWCYNKIEPFLGRKILELGSGIGTISKYLVKKDKEVTLLDIDKEYTNYLRNRFISNPSVKIVDADILKADKVLTERNFDTVVGINVLEHVNNDVEAIERLKKIITTNGRLVLIVPAHKILFSNFDKRLGHYRRYSKEELQDKLQKGGFFIEKIEFMNVLATIGWFLQFRLLKKKRMSKTTIQFFDKLIPLIALIEKYVRFPFGLSLLCVARSR